MNLSIINTLSDDDLIYVASYMGVFDFLQYKAVGLWVVPLNLAAYNLSDM